MDTSYLSQLIQQVQGWQLLAGSTCLFLLLYLRNKYNKKTPTERRRFITKIPAELVIEKEDG